MKDEIEKPITAKEAAAYLGIHYKSIYRYMKEGKLTSFHRLGRNVYFFKSELYAFIKES